MVLMVLKRYTVILQKHPSGTPISRPNDAKL